MKDFDTIINKNNVMEVFNDLMHIELHGHWKNEEVPKWMIELEKFYSLPTGQTTLRFIAWREVAKILFLHSDFYPAT